MADLRPCTDRHCILRTEPYHGMATNGGCAHLKLDDVETRRLLRLVARDRAQLAAELRAARREAL